MRHFTRLPTGVVIVMFNRHYLAKSLIFTGRTSTLLLLSAVLCLLAPPPHTSTADGVPKHTANVTPIRVSATLPAPAVSTAVASRTPAASPTSPKITATPLCTPLAHLTSAAPLSISPPGLHAIVDTPETYAIYGDTPAQVRAQMQACAPGTGHEFSGSTDFWLGSQYRYTSTSADTCQLTDVAVTLHVHQTLPSWVASANAEAGLTGAWQAYMTHLKTHENGHATLDMQYAALAQTTLENLPPIPCSTVSATVTAKMNSIVAALNVANDTYDTATQHGATQGAIWP